MVFIHGLDSSSKGTKAAWFGRHFPEMVIADFEGDLSQRMKKLESILAYRQNVTLIGSSFGGLMATIFALENEAAVSRVILLAPALNFPEFSEYKGRKTAIPAWLFIGKKDKVTPSDIVIPAARQTFSNLIINESDDDHLLRNTFEKIDWQDLLLQDQ
ncbi:MAG: alpha/beta hydrolase [Proteobacteria bacterium]|nr:alpha/beta hydrolase [Pseudomonadota bacterium]MBU1710032.1 alpha/beta hydrolase [Pseudomonadota bacterium]